MNNINTLTHSLIVATKIFESELSKKIIKNEYLITNPDYQKVKFKYEISLLQSDLVIISLICLPHAQLRKSQLNREIIRVKTDMTLRVSPAA